ncbi:MAG: MBL fold metallo-hydrolase [Bacteroidota bacterium]|nr:MBL fold metallo-hydrolase [Bacteroidota bacterium]
MRLFFTFIIFFFICNGIACRSKNTNTVNVDKNDLPDTFLVVLGIAQDGGYPQLACTKECCAAYWSAGSGGQGKEQKKHITCLALVDRKSSQYWLFEATPDITSQLKEVQSYIPAKDNYTADGIFISHAHIGHYSGLLQLGREAMGAQSVPVWVMPRLDSFLRNNGPWSQLVTLKNIELKNLQADSGVSLTAKLKVTPVKVPHRDEFSETVGFVIESDKKKVLFIPDIDKWEKWEKDIVAEIGKVDMALLDGTFYTNAELPGRDMKEVPHPFVVESLQTFYSLSPAERSKIVFIHFNHTNPLLKKESAERKKVGADGFGVAEEGMIIKL